jgi:hypothetical protein
MIYQLDNLTDTTVLKKRGLSEPGPVTTLVPFWMEGNSSTDFGLANDL